MCGELHQARLTLLRFPLVAGQVYNSHRQSPSQVTLGEKCRSGQPCTHHLRVLCKSAVGSPAFASAFKWQLAEPKTRVAHRQCPAPPTAGTPGQRVRSGKWQEEGSAGRKGRSAPARAHPLLVHSSPGILPGCVPSPISGLFPGAAVRNGLEGLHSRSAVSQSWSQDHGAAGRLVPPESCEGECVPGLSPSFW